MQDIHRPFSRLFAEFTTRKERFAILDDQTAALVRGSRRSIERSLQLLARTHDCVGAVTAERADKPEREGDEPGPR